MIDVEVVPVYFVPFSVVSAIFVSACTFSKYALFPSGVALIVASPGFQFAGHTSPYLSVNWKASMRRRVSSTLRPTERSLIVICVPMVSPLPNRSRYQPLAAPLHAHSHYSLLPSSVPCILYVPASQSQSDR